MLLVATLAAARGSPAAAPRAATAGFALPAAYRFEVERTAGPPRGIVHARGDGVAHRPIDRRTGWIPSSAVSLTSPDGIPALAVLWLEAASGREADVRLYRLPDGARVWQSPGATRAGLAQAEGPSRFDVTAPLDLLDRPPPHLIVRRRFEWTGTFVRSVGRFKDAPRTPTHELSWAADEIAEGRPAKALEALEAFERRHARSVGLDEERAIALDLAARGLARMGRAAALVTTLERLAREHPDRPAGHSARAGLDFIGSHSVEAYLRHVTAADEGPPGQR